ncbi:hypothetical protein N7466_011067 [Penicillium verhagenii]|uniref:uncharacterized protein n=1 Tax=Penicillium verhagenii TaxID=1562060 RepID=UPI0025453AFB|nr:uncharacterized protein N7466_011067 [Penicillium verhagenii]KAJ5917513.1 hypothetical protein N7466_011067 [Penicillium verhagenii]
MQYLDFVDADRAAIQRKTLIGNLEYHSRESADEQSWSATSCLYNWHRRYDDWLWLDDGNTSEKEVRLFQQHSWIVDPFHLSEQYDPPVAEKKECLNEQDILNCAAKVQ